MAHANAMSEQRDFITQQYAFAAHIRNPARNPAPAGIEDRRLGVYRELFFNNVNGFLADTMPVLHSIIDADAWIALVRDFFAHHQSHSPYFLDIPREFLTYLDEERGDHPDDPPFLRELAHYEWVELALSVHDAQVDQERVQPDGDLLSGQPLISPLAWPLSYAFPVHRISPEFQPAAAPPQATHLVVYRDTDDTVRFLELNPVSARLLGLLAAQADGAATTGTGAGAYTGRQALEAIAGELQHPQPEQVIQGGAQILSDWRERGILLGTARI